MPTLQQMATVLRSKNAGPFQITLDVIFADSATWQQVIDAGVLTVDRIAALYGVEGENVSIIPFARAHAIKVTLSRTTGERGSGSAFDRDVYGAQQHGLLGEIQCEGSLCETPRSIDGSHHAVVQSIPPAEFGGQAPTHAFVTSTK